MKKENVIIELIGVNKEYGSFTEFGKQIDLKQRRELTRRRTKCNISCNSSRIRKCKSIKHYERRFRNFKRKGKFSFNR